MKVVLVLLLAFWLIFEPSESHGFYPGIFMNTGRQSSRYHTRHGEPAEPTEMENDEQEELTKEDIEEMIEEMAKEIRQLLKLQKLHRGKGHNYDKEIPISIARLMM